MSLSPLLSDTPFIAVHTASALLALAIGPLAILRRRRDRLHRLAGRAWVGLMVLALVSAFGIHGGGVIGPFSALHLLPVVVGVMLWRAVAAIRAGDLVAHGRTMVQLYIWSLLVAGAFTLLPGRRMNAVLLGGESWAGFAAGAVALGAVAVWLWRAQPPLPPRRRGGTVARAREA